MNKEQVIAKVQALEESENHGWVDDFYQIPDLLSDMYASGYVEAAIENFPMEDFSTSKRKLIEVLNYEIWDKNK